MKELVPKDSYGIFADSNDTARVDSLFVAKFFNKRHDHVLRDIENFVQMSSVSSILGRPPTRTVRAESKKRLQ